MCGIFVEQGGTGENAERCLARLSHRGPDHEGLLSSGSVTLGHRRLSIIDLSERSNEPLQSGSGRNVIVFNGEIYNYKELKEQLRADGCSFRTHGDAEVVLEGYERHGSAFFERLRGMFAFVIHDRDAERLVAARDAFGIKPLVYAKHAGSVYFASESKCLFAAMPKEPDPTGFPAFYNLGYFIAPATPYRNVWRLIPGEILACDTKTQEFSRIGRIPVLAEAGKTASTREEALDLLDASLTDAVAAHYVSDVPVSLLLSGGNDSSLIAALSHKLGKAPHAYHVAIAGSDDTPYAKAVAEALGLPLTIETLTEEALAAQYEKVFDLLDEPTGDLSILPTSLIYERIRGKAKVVLSGEGGDELFGGYVRHRLLANHRRVSAKNALNGFLNSLTLPNRLGLALVNPLVGRLRDFLLRQRATDDLIGAYLRATRLMDYPIADGAVRNQLAALYESDTEEGIAPSLAFDTLLYLPNDLLPKSDIASMASSIEARVPLVDRFLARDVANVAAYRERALGGKELLKDVLCRYLPRELVYRSKSGFGVPVHAYDSKRFTADFHSACIYLLAHRAGFGVDDALARLIRDASSRDLIAKKYPRFAFALVSTWKLFAI
jgi:asparagine synthase (glutamine-hydrolysing)